MQPLPQTQRPARRWIIAVVLFVLFLVITSQFPVLEMLPFIWGGLLDLTAKIWGAILMAFGSIL